MSNAQANIYFLEEVVLFLLTLAASSSVIYRIRQFGGLRKCLEQFAAGDTEARPVLLFLLLVPITMLSVLTLLVLLRAQPRNTLPILFIILFSLLAILTLYFYNGKLVQLLRDAVRKGIELWNQFGMR